MRFYRDVPPVSVDSRDERDFEKQGRSEACSGRVGQSRFSTAERVAARCVNTGGLWKARVALADVLKRVDP